MILILSEDDDETTAIVVDWLQKFGARHVRVNKENSIVVNKISESGFDISIGNDLVLKSDDISAFWYRRGYFYSDVAIDWPQNGTMNAVRRHLRLEWEGINEVLIYHLNKIPALGDFRNSHLNKLQELADAQHFGLKTPRTLVTSKKALLLEFIDNCKSVVTKPINYPLTISLDDCRYMTYTELVDDRLLERMSDTIAPSLFQENVQKRYEIRAYYLEGEFYSMAIFSQRNTQTATDFRKYDYKLPNRTSNFKLPADIEEKLRLLINYYELNTCSVDLLVTGSLEFVFLEINPVGQFGMVSYPCNYALERKIAEALIKGPTRRWRN